MHLENWTHANAIYSRWITTQFFKYSIIIIIFFFSCSFMIETRRITTPNYGVWRFFFVLFLFLLFFNVFVCARCNWKLLHNKHKSQARDFMQRRRIILAVLLVCPFAIIQCYCRRQRWQRPTNTREKQFTTSMSNYIKNEYMPEVTDATRTRNKVKTRTRKRKKKSIPLKRKKNILTITISIMEFYFFDELSLSFFFEHTHTHSSSLSLAYVVVCVLLYFTLLYITSLKSKCESFVLSKWWNDVADWLNSVWY